MPNQVLRNFCSFIPFIYYSVFYHADLTLFLIFLSFIIINISAYRNECYRLSQRTPSAYRNERYRLSQRTPSAYRNEHLRLIATNAIAYRNEHLRLIATNAIAYRSRYHRGLQNGADFSAPPSVDTPVTIYGQCHLVSTLTRCPFISAIPQTLLSPP